jgi:hypothetical protein
MNPLNIHYESNLVPMLVIQEHGYTPISCLIGPGNKKVSLCVRQGDKISQVKEDICEKAPECATGFYLSIGQTRKRLDEDATVQDSGITPDAEIFGELSLPQIHRIAG